MANGQQEGQARKRRYGHHSEVEEEEELTIAIEHHDYSSNSSLPNLHQSFWRHNSKNFLRRLYQRKIPLTITLLLLLGALFLLFPRLTFPAPQLLDGTPRIKNASQNGTINDATRIDSWNKSISAPEESFRKGFWQRTKPFPVEYLNMNVTCQVPITTATKTIKEWQRRAPYVLLLGSQKGGTTAMAYYLYNHPNIPYLPSKELHFFDEDMDQSISNNSFSNHFHLNGSAVLEAYQQNAIAPQCPLERLQTTNQKFILDATPNYLFASDRVPQRVLCACGPWVRLLVLLRNPVDRAWSQYAMQVQHDLTTRKNTSKASTFLSFEEYIELDMKVLQETGVLPPRQGFSLDDHSGSLLEFEAWKRYTRLGINSPVGRGLYSIQIRHWLRAMDQFDKPRSDLLILTTERMRQDSKAVYQQVVQFLDLPKHELQSFDTIHESKFLSSHTAMKPETRQFLQDFYRPYNAQLKDLLGSEWDGIWE
eukprot:scaffold22653_cov119-Cylindrotheca_fusiformis.AAC.19